MAGDGIIDQLGISTHKQFGGITNFKLNGKPKSAKGPKKPPEPKKITTLEHADGMARGLQRRMSSPHSRLSSPRPASARIPHKF